MPPALCHLQYLPVHSVRKMAASALQLGAQADSLELLAISSENMPVRQFLHATAWTMKLHVLLVSHT